MSEVVDGRLDRAKKMGADYCINSLKEDVEARVKDITGGEGPNVIIDCAGLPQMLDQFVRMVSFGGRVVLMGVNLKGSSYPMLWVSVKEVGIVGSRMQCHKFKPVIENIDDYLSKADLLVTDVFPFEKAEEAFALAAKAAPDTSKVVVKF
jgi:L-gulonate 5-dehydrogenase